jgi:hypothetical protein
MAAKDTPTMINHPFDHALSDGPYGPLNDALRRMPLLPVNALADALARHR